MLKHPINFRALPIYIFAIGVMTVVSFFGAWTYDEGMMSSPILAFLFNIFRFPTHTFLGDVFTQSAMTFYSGLIINIVLYAFLTERLISLIKGQKANG